MRAVLYAVTTGLTVAGLLFAARKDIGAPAYGHAIPALIVKGDYERAELAARRQVADTRTAYGPQSIEYAQAVDTLVQALDANGRTAQDETLALAEEGVLRHRALVPARPDLILYALIHQGQVLTHRAAYPRAIEVLNDAVGHAERSFGANDPRTADALAALGATYLESRAYVRAWQVLTRGMRIMRRAAPDGDDTTARTLESIAAVCQRRGSYVEARTYLKEALATRRSVSAAHPSRVASLNLLALQLWFEGQLTASKAASRRALALAEQTLRPEHPQIGETLRILAATLWSLGELSEARTYSTRALEIARGSLGDRHPEVAALWNDLGNVNLEMGAYADARRQFVEALRLANATLGGRHEWIPNFTHNLGLVDAALGNFDAARQEQEQAIALWERSLKPDHPFVAVALVELAAVLRAQGAPAAALPLLQRALAIREHRLGPSHHETAATLVDLAATSLELGDRPAARRTADRAIAIWEAADSQDSPAHATVLELYANLRMSEKDLPSALRYFERALDIRVRALGPNHPLVADVMARLASAQASMGLDAEAITSAFAAENIGRDHLRLMLRYLPEHEALTYAAARPRGLDLILSLATKRDQAAPALDALIRSRALVLDEMAARRRLQSPDRDVAELQAALVNAQQRLANALVRGPHRSEPDRYQTLVHDARRTSENAERALAERSAAYRAERSEAQVGLHEIRRAMPAAGALVSYVRFDRLVPNGRSIPSYAAFVTRADREPVAVLLANAASVDAQVERWRIALQRDAASRFTREPSGLLDAGLALRAAVWDPLTPYLAGAATIFVVPDGMLNLVAFAGLPGYAREYLLEEPFALHYLSSERDLAVDYAPSQQTRLLAVGGAAFGTPVSVASGLKQAGTGAPSTSPSSWPCEAIERLSFPPLPNTLEEATEIARVWNAVVSTPDAESRLLLASEADETTFKRLAPQYRVLHLATHGFFLNGLCAGSLVNTRAASGIRAADVTNARAAAPAAGERALRLSGLAFAGANRRASVENPGDDGILTAEEVAALDLREVEWAVLSACDTGVGHVQAGEGVLGLRRAFEVAGVHTVIMSLWPVEDVSTRQWMVALYDSHLRNRRGTAAAVRDASLALLDARRNRKESTSPLYWAAFVAAGDWK